MMNPTISDNPPSSNFSRKAQRESGVWWQGWLHKQFHYLMDLLIFVLAFLLAYSLRFDFEIPRPYLDRGLVQVPLVVLLQFAVMNIFGVYSFVWRFIGITELKSFLKAALWSSIPLLFLRAVLPDSLHQFRVPISIILMDTGLAVGGALGLRVLRRALYERYEKKATDEPGGPRARPTLLVGAGSAGVMTAKVILARREMNFQIKGFVDDDPKKRGAVIQGIKVLGTTRDLPRLVAEHDIRHVVIAIAQATRNDFRRILDICSQLQVKVQVIPGLSEILQEKVKVSRIRDVEIEDLLGREQVRLDEVSMGRLLTGKTVLISGAGGSIGSELARQVCRFGPAKILLVERAEFSLFNIERELRQRYPELALVPLIADVGDGSRMRQVFAVHRPQVVLHAAAHKHVPMMEYNATEAVKNNILATHLLGDLAGTFGVEAFVLISTDKAVHPTSIMGASKRVAELVVQDLNKKYRTSFVAVRFGNVIGSTGSVIPIFREQIRQGGPVTVTHKDMVRYFMTIPEATQLVLQAGAIGKGGEIFILDMGEPVSILDLAKATIILSGLKPYEDIDIVFTGARPGEKLFEELETSGEEISKTLHPKIFIGKIASYPAEDVRRALERLGRIAERGDEKELRTFLNEFLPEANLRVGDASSGGPTLSVVTAANIA
jgi:FlaA1/EpsC-like NDP-sugar epimerase